MALPALAAPLGHPDPVRRTLRVARRTAGAASHRVLRLPRGGTTHHPPHLDDPTGGQPLGQVQLPTHPTDPAEHLDLVPGAGARGHPV